MADDPYEPNRVLGMPIRSNPNAPQGVEPKRALGFPVDWSEPVDFSWLVSLAHPIRGYRLWVRRRRLGPYATDEDEPRRSS